MMGATNTTAQTGAADAHRGLSAVRIGGYALYNLWLCTIFYNTFFFLSASSNVRDVLYLDQMLSLGVLVLTLFAMPLTVRHADKWVLSRHFIWGAGIVLALFTSLLMLVSPGDPGSNTLIVVSALGSGVSSGVLFLGWGRLYADVGPRKAMAEIALAWILAAAANVALSFAPPQLASLTVLVGVVASALLLRRSTFQRPQRPTPAREHKLQKRTRRMFTRGLLACLGIGVVAGFADVLTGFRFVQAPDHYEVMLSLGVIVAVLAILGIAMASTHDFVTYAYRATTLMLVMGCLLTPFVFGSYIYSNVVIFGAYTAFAVVLCVVCIDVSNYFDMPATKAFGTTFAALYAGELAGNGLGHLMVDIMSLSMADLNIVGFVLTVGIVFANLFLFTEKDLTETGLGEMIDEDGTPSRWATEPADSPEAPGTQDERTAVVAALLAERYGLTPREAEVLPLVIKGRTIARIQEELHISQGTVSTHTRHIYQKVGVRNRQALLDLVETLET